MDNASINQMANYVFSITTISMLSYLCLKVASKSNETNIDIINRHMQELREYTDNSKDPRKERVYKILVEGIKNYHKKVKLSFFPVDGFFDGLRKRKELTNLLSQL